MIYNVQCIDSVIYIDAYPVASFWSSLSTRTSFSFFWAAPSTGAQFTQNYHVRCDPQLIDELPTRQSIVPASQSSAVVTDLHPGTRYNCSIFTEGALGLSAPKSTSIIIPDAGMVFHKVVRA